MAVQRDELGRLQKGSILNPNGNTQLAGWIKLKAKITDDIDALYKETKQLLADTTKDNVKANILLTLLTLLKPSGREDDNAKDTTTFRWETLREVVRQNMEKDERIQALERTMKELKQEREAVPIIDTQSELQDSSNVISVTPTIEPLTVAPEACEETIGAEAAPITVHVVPEN